MAFSDLYKLSAHAVITNNKTQVLQLKQTYGDQRWGLPGGSPDLGESIQEALFRECFEELGINVEIDYLSGIYYHSEFNSHVFIFKCKAENLELIKLSTEHSDYKFFDLLELNSIQRIRVSDCIDFNGTIVSRKF